MKEVAILREIRLKHKNVKYSQSYDTVCRLALLGFKGLKDVGQQAKETVVK